MAFNPTSSGLWLQILRLILLFLLLLLLLVVWVRPLMLDVGVDLFPRRALSELMTNLAFVMIVQLVLVEVLVATDFMPYGVHFLCVLGSLMGHNCAVVI